MCAFNKKLFVVCTKEGTFIKECIESIISHYPEDDILIVDSNSNDKSYIKEVLKKYKNVRVSRYVNKYYEYGSILYGFVNNKNKYDIFFFMQDSMRLCNKIDLSILDKDSVLVFAEHSLAWGNWYIRYERLKGMYSKFFEHPKYTYPNNLLIAQFNSFIIFSSTFDKCINSEAFRLAPGAPRDKVASANWERLWGTVFCMNDIKIKTIKNLNNVIKIYGNRE